MSKYKVVINYTVAYSLAVAVDADNPDEALDKVNNKWYSGDALRIKATESSDFSEMNMVVDSEITEEAAKGMVNV